MTPISEPAPSDHCTAASSLQHPWPAAAQVS